MNFWHQAPFVRLVLPLLAGIITAAFLPVLIPFSPAIVLGLTILLFLFSFSSVIHSKYIFRWVYGAFLSLVFFSYGYEITIRNTGRLLSSHYSKIYSNPDRVIAMVAEPAVAKEKSLKTVLEVKEVLKGNRRFPVTGKILAYIQKDSVAEAIQYGNILVFCANLAPVPPPQNPEEFNYKRFLFFHGIYHQVYLNNLAYRLLDTAPPDNLPGIANRTRNYLMKVFEKYSISGDEYSVASALMLGSREEIDSELVQAFASAGALHVLSVSGLHVGVIFMVMAYLLAFLDKFRYGIIIKTALLLLGLWFYALLTGLSPSVVRASTMFSFVVVGKAGKWNTNIYNILACSAFFLLIINPFLIMEVGFQLSFLAVLGIVFIQPRLSQLWDTYIPAAGRLGNWLIQQVCTITTVSIAAQVATFPLGLLYFHQFPNYFIFSNLVVIPLSTLIIYCGVLLFVVSPVEMISEYVAWAFKGSITLMNKSVLLVEQLPFSLLQGISISIIETWLIYFLIIFLLAFFIVQNLKYVRVSFIILISLLCYQVYENHIQQNQKKFIVYNISKVSAFDFIEGKKNLLLADSSFINNDSRLLFHVKHHWWELGIDKNLLFDFKKTRQIEGKNIFMKDGFVHFCGKRLFFVKHGFPEIHPENKTVVDYLIISGSPGISIEKLKNIFDFGQIIIDASNNKYVTGKLIREARSLNIECYSVTQNGAFVAEW